MSGGAAGFGRRQVRAEVNTSTEPRSTPNAISAPAATRGAASATASANASKFSESMAFAAIFRGARRAFHPRPTFMSAGDTGAVTDHQQKLPRD